MGPRAVATPLPEPDVWQLLAPQQPQPQPQSAWMPVPGPAGEVRILATLAAVDIVGSTGLIARIGDEAWSRHLDWFLTQAHRLIADSAGRCLDHQGDGLLAMFPSPTAAVRTTARLAEHCRPAGLELRSGIHLGEFLLGPVRSCGLALHVAIRLQSAAGPGEILVSDDAARFADRTVTFADQRRLNLKGLAEPLPVRSVLTVA